MAETGPRAELVREWSQWVAAEPIDIGGARAFNPGDPVPATHVERDIVAPHQVRQTQPPPGEPENTADPKGEN